MLLLVCGLCGCAQLLDLPDNPHLAVNAEAPPNDAGIPSMRPADVGSGPGAEPAPAGESVESPDFPLVAAPLPAANSSGGGEPDPLPAARPPDAGSPVPEVPVEVPVVTCAVAESAGPDGRCYFVIADMLSWEDSRARCRQRAGGGDLASLGTDAENRFISQLANGDAWIGASDADEEGTWVWVDDGRAFSSAVGAQVTPLEGAYASWYDDEPNGEESSNCARLLPPTFLSATGAPGWADLECEEQRRAVCEGPPP